MCREVWPFCIRGLVSQTPWPAHRWWWWSEEGSPLGWNNTSNVQTGPKPQLNWWLLVVYRLATFHIVRYRHCFWQKVVWCGIYNSPLLTSIVLSCVFVLFFCTRWGGGGGGGGGKGGGNLVLVNIMYFSPLVFVKGPLICFLGIFQIFTETKHRYATHIQTADDAKGKTFIIAGVIGFVPF